MTTSVDQNSAGILSLWHCIFAVSTNKDAKQGTPKEENSQAMKETYMHMKHLRMAIQGLDNPNYISVSKIAKPFNAIFSGEPKEKWIEQLCSLMAEVVTMKDELKSIKEHMYSIDICNSDALVIDNQPKNVITLLTLWYWLAVWSSVDLPENHSDKDEFMRAIEAHHNMLGSLLVSTSPVVNPEEQQELKSLFSKLLQMLKSDHQFWTDVLNQFIVRMYSTTESIYPKSFENTNNNTQSVSISAVGTVVKELAKTAAFEAALQAAKQAYEHRDVILDKAKELGDDAVELIKNAALQVEEGAENIIEEVTNVAVVLGEGMEKMGKDIVQGAENFGKAVEKTAEDIGDAITDAAKQAGDAIGDVAKEAGDAILKGLGMLKFW